MKSSAWLPVFSLVVMSAVGTAQTDESTAGFLHPASADVCYEPDPEIPRFDDASSCREYAMATEACWSRYEDVEM